MAEPPALPRLIVLAPSHFCEKARCVCAAAASVVLRLLSLRFCSRAAPRRLPARSWALERYGVPHVVEPHAPVFHVPAVKAAGKEGSTSTPLLVVPTEAATLPLLLAPAALPALLPPPLRLR